MVKLGFILRSKCSGMQCLEKGLLYEFPDHVSDLMSSSVRWRWKEDEPEEDDIKNIVTIHNANNEQAWQEVLKWEMFHCKSVLSPNIL